MRKYESIELYKQGDCLYWESIEEFEEFSRELVQKVREELSKHSNPTLTTISFEAKNYYEYGENYPYEVIELDFERDMTQEEIDEDNNRYSLKKEQKNLEEELRANGLNGNLAYDNSFAKAYKEGLIIINREKIND
jgi:uroporphyrinogen-III decarboxylase